MSYIDNNLMNGEKVIYRGQLHWAVYILPAILLVFALPNLSGDAAPIGAMFLVIATLTGISAIITRKTSEFGITNKRVIVKVGFIRRTSVEVLLNKVEGIQVQQGITGRILNFGSLTISGTGGTKDPFHKICAPLEFRKIAQEQIAIVQDIK